MFLSVCNVIGQNISKQKLFEIRQRENIKASKIKTESVQIREPSGSNVFSVTEFNMYDEEGYLIEKTEISNVERTVYKYDDSGNLIKEDIYSGHLLELDELVQRNEYIYDSQGRKVNGYIYWSENGSLKRKQNVMYGYNENGNLLSETFLDLNDIVKWKVNYEYDGEGNLIKKSYCISADSIKSIYLFEYDYSGNRTSELKYNGNEEIVYKYLNSYDSKGNNVMSERYNNKNVIDAVYNYTYDSYGNLLEVIIDESGKSHNNF